MNANLDSPRVTPTFTLDIFMFFMLLLKESEAHILRGKLQSMQLRH